MQHYRATYTDSSGTNEITITNDFRTMWCEIDGVKFEGLEFGDFELIDKANYSEEKLKRFSLLELTSSDTGIVSEYLIDYSISLIIPQIIIDKTKNEEFYIDLHLEFSDDRQRKNSRGWPETETIKLSLTIDGQNFEGVSHHYIESAFNQIHKQFIDRYTFKNCIGCMFSDYNAYGQRMFGSIECHINQKEAYLKVKDKNDLLNLAGNPTEVPEIYCCDKYEVRKPGIGFRRVDSVIDEFLN